MARYESVEGSSSKFWEVRLDGASLAVKYGRIGTAGQSQTKTFATPDLARREHDKLVAEKTKKGYKLANGEQPTPTAPPQAAAKNGTATAASVRKDLYVYNEATGFAITSGRLGGKGIDGGSDAWHKAVRRGDLIPIELIQDDPFFIRVVVGGELEPQEAEEWVGRLDWKLRVPDGDLVVCGGAEYVMEEFENEESSYMAQYVRHVQIPRGEYRATVYMYFRGVNGHACLRVAKEGDEPDPLGEWFRATRPNEEFPAWLHNDCVSDPDEDPGHQKEWKQKKPVTDPNPHYLDFLLHLTPLDPGERVVMPTIATEGGENGWFCQPFTCRVPDRIPLGLPSRDPEGLERDGEAGTGTGDQPVAVHLHTARFPLQPVEGSVNLPVVDIVRLYRLAWFCQSWSMPYMTIEAPAGTELPVIGADVEGVKLTRDARTLTVAFIPTGRQGGALRGLAAIAPMLKGLPDGSVLSLEAANVDSDELEKPRPNGLHRYKGRIAGDAVTITHAFPVLDAGKLNAALALAAQVDTASLIDAGNPEIAAAVMRSLREHPYFQDNPAVRRGATGITTKKSEPMLLNVIAEEVFRKTFKDDFPVFDIDLDDEEEDDDEDIGTFPVAPRAAEPPMPPIGAELLKGNRKRTFYTSDSSGMGPETQKRIAEIEAQLLPLGFALVGEVVCKPMQAVMIRGYAHSNGTAWAAMTISSYSRGTFEFVSSFEKGATLTTTTNPTAHDDLFRNIFRTQCGNVSVAEMWSRHEQRVAHLSRFHGAAQRIDATPMGLAMAVELSIQRQEESKPAADKRLLLKDEYSFYTADAQAIHPAVPGLVADADAQMQALGFGGSVGDAVATMFSSRVHRGYASGDTWALFIVDVSSFAEPTGMWDFVTMFEKGAVLSSTRVALSKDEPKRKIFRILDPSTRAADLLAKHERRKGELSKKWGQPLPVAGDHKGLAEQVSQLIKRTIG